MLERDLQKVGYGKWPSIAENIIETIHAGQFYSKRFQRYDLGFTTDRNGDPMILFMGTLAANGKIKGRRYARRLVKDASGSVIKDHWDDKGPAG